MKDQEILEKINALAEEIAPHQSMVACMLWAVGDAIQKQHSPDLVALIQNYSDSLQLKAHQYQQDSIQGALGYLNSPPSDDEQATVVQTKAFTISTCPAPKSINVDTNFDIRLDPSLQMLIESIPGVSIADTKAFKYSFVVIIGELFDREEVMKDLHRVLTDYVNN